MFVLTTLPSLFFTSCAQLESVTCLFNIGVYLPNNLSCTVMGLQRITVLLMSGRKIHSLVDIGVSSYWTPSYEVGTLLLLVM